jgi:5'-nucleotidase
MHILVTNDDGVTAPGLLILAQALRPFGAVNVVAPDHDWSGHGHTKHFKRPLRVQEIHLADGSPAYVTDGSPADCVALAVMGLLPKKVDLVVSGINNAPNLGHDISYSGTVAAVKEANIWGVSGIAISLDVKRGQREEPNYNLAAAVVCHIIQTMQQNHLPPDVFLNVNVPDVPTGQFQGIRLTRQGLRIYRDRLEKRRDPRGESYYWISGDAPSGVPLTGTDIGAITQGYASVTPLKLDQTADASLAWQAEWVWPITGVRNGHGNGVIARETTVNN